jgi:phospholipase C
MGGGSNLWSGIWGAYDEGLKDKWALKNTPHNMAYFKRQDIPVHWGIAEAFTVGDMYQHSIMSSTDPNRIFWNSGTVGVTGGPQTTKQGGPALQNGDRTPGCVRDDPLLDCWPLTWTTIQEHVQSAGVTWQVSRMQRMLMLITFFITSLASTMQKQEIRFMSMGLLAMRIALWMLFSSELKMGRSHK